MEMNMDFARLALFGLAVVGLTNIIVDPASIARPLREYVEKNCPSWLDKLLSCYQCSGTWSGFLLGYLLVGTDLGTVFACGMAGSFLATISATYLNYLEAQSILGVEDDG